MANMTVNYREVLADLETRRNKLNVAIAAIKDILAESDKDAAPSLFYNTRQEKGVYADMTLVDAAIHFLRSVKTPQPTNAIVTALKRGGTHSVSKNLYRTIY